MKQDNKKKPVQIDLNELGKFTLHLRDNTNLRLDKQVLYPSHLVDVLRQDLSTIANSQEMIFHCVDREHTFEINGKTYYDASVRFYVSCHDKDKTLMVYFSARDKNNWSTDNALTDSAQKLLYNTYSEVCKSIYSTALPVLQQSCVARYLANHQDRLDELQTNINHVQTVLNTTT